MSDLVDKLMTSGTKKKGDAVTSGARQRDDPARGGQVSAAAVGASLNPLAGKPAPRNLLVDVPRLITAYYSERPDVSVVSQKVAFRHVRGIAAARSRASFNGSARAGDHAGDLRLPQAAGHHRATIPRGRIACALRARVRKRPGGAGRERCGNDGLGGDEFTPTPAVSHAILVYNRGRTSGLADGIVITPSHNPPDSGGFKYNPTNGGPADTDATSWIENEANRILPRPASWT